MSYYVELSIKGEIKPDAARTLILMIEDWSMIRDLDSPLPDASFKKAHRLLEDMFMSSSKDTLGALKKNQLLLHSEYKTHDEFNFFINNFLPHILVSLEEGWFIFEDGARRRMLTFDPETRKITKRTAKEKPWAQLQEARAEEERRQAWEAEYGNIEITKWRKGLARILLFIADLEKQQQNFVEKKPSKEMPATSWDDLSVIYFSILNLENGFSYALKKKFLSKAEVAQLKEFDRLLRHYVLPDREGKKSSSMLNDPEWLVISDEAKKLSATIVPKLM